MQIVAGIEKRQALVLNPADSIADGDAVTVMAEAAIEVCRCRQCWNRKA